jgi:hypothetical protein
MTKKAIMPTEECDREAKPIEALEVSPAVETPQQRLARVREEELKLVKGIFRNYENPGFDEYVCYEKYKGVPKFAQRMWDGQEYEIPLYIARFIQGYEALAPEGYRKTNSCAIPVGQIIHTDTGPAVPQTKSGSPITAPMRWQRRIGFEVAGFYE